LYLSFNQKKGSGPRNFKLVLDFKQAKGITDSRETEEFTIATVATKLNEEGFVG